MDQWYYLDGDKRVGPFDVGAIQQLLRAGIIGEASLVARVGDAEWKPASSLVEKKEPMAQEAVPTPSVTRPPASRGFDVGPLKPISLATGAFVGFFVIQLLLLRSYFGRTNVNPRMEFAWDRAFASCAVTVTALILLAITLGTVDWFRRKRILGGKKSAAWLWTLVVMWLVVAVACNWANHSPAHTTGYLKLTAMYMQGAGGSAVLYVAVLALAVVVTVAVGGSLAARRVIKASAAARVLPPVPTLIAGVVARMVVVLAFFAGMFSWSVPMMKWPPKKNTDRRTIDLIVRAIEDYSANEKESLGRAWCQLLDMAPRTQQQTWFGDSMGHIDHNLMGLLGKHLDESLKSRAEILDTWGQPVRAALDGDGDGMINFGVEEQLQGRAAVWTIGWNGVDERGGGDDVMVVIGGL